MKKDILILHAGLHKTGTSFLQQALVRNNFILNKSGWDFVFTGESGNTSHLIGVKNNDVIDGYVKDRFYNVLLESKYNKNIISAEYLSFISSFDEIIKIKNILLSMYEDVKVIFYVRSQDELALSFKQQSSKTPKPMQMPSSKLIGHSLSPFPELTEKVINYFDYYKKIKMWEMAFGRDGVKIVNYKRKKGKDFLVDFLDCFGTHFDGLVVDDVDVNSGVSRQESMINHYFLSRGFNKPKIKNKKNFFIDQVKILPSQNEVKDFISCFESSNEMLFQDYGVELNIDIDKYPAIGNYNFTYEDIDLILKIKDGGDF